MELIVQSNDVVTAALSPTSSEFTASTARQFTGTCIRGAWKDVINILFT